LALAIPAVAVHAKDAWKGAGGDGPIQLTMLQVDGINDVQVGAELTKKTPQAATYLSMTAHIAVLPGYLKAFLAGNQSVRCCCHAYAELAC